MNSRFSLIDLLKFVLISQQIDRSTLIAIWSQISIDSAMGNQFSFDFTILRIEKDNRPVVRPLVINFRPCWKFLIQKSLHERDVNAGRIFSTEFWRVSRNIMRIFERDRSVRAWFPGVPSDELSKSFVLGSGRRSLRARHPSSLTLARAPVLSYLGLSPLSLQPLLLLLLDLFLCIFFSLHSR